MSSSLGAEQALFRIFSSCQAFGRKGGRRRIVCCFNGPVTSRLRLPAAISHGVKFAKRTGSVPENVAAARKTRQRARLLDALVDDMVRFLAVNYEDIGKRRA